MIEFVSELERRAYFPGLVDICKGKSDNLLFLFVKEGKAFLDEKITLDGGDFLPPELKDLPRQTGEGLPDGREVLYWIGRQDDDLYGDLVNYLKRFCYLDAPQLSLVAHYAFMTYLHDHPDIGYCPYLLFYAVPERGKSRAGKALSYVSFRGFHSVDLREAILFRFAERLHGTLFLDVMDLWKKAQNNGCEDILLCRFEKGVQCSRVMYPDRGAFRDMEHYDIYGPTIIATNEPLHNILGTRCLPITMPNHPGSYENPKPEYALSLKARLCAWRAKHLSCVLPEVSVIEGIDGRLWDISKPLFQIGRIINPADEFHLESLILAIAGDKAAEKSGTIEGRIVGAIRELSEANGFARLPEWWLRASEITKKFNEARPADRSVSASWIGIRLTGLSLRKRQINGRSEYLISHDEYRALLAQYGLEQKQIYPSTPKTPDLNLPTSGLPENEAAFQGVTGDVGGCRGLREEAAIDELSEERAAIMQYEGGLGREMAEEKAFRDVPF